MRTWRHTGGCRVFESGISLYLAVGQAPQEVGLSAAVLADQTISATNSQLDAAVLDKLGASQAHRKPEQTRGSHARVSDNSIVPAEKARCGADTELSTHPSILISREVGLLTNTPVTVRLTSSKLKLLRALEEAMEERPPAL